jgi:hypothetical protein
MERVLPLLSPACAARQLASVRPTPVTPIRLVEAGFASNTRLANLRAAADKANDGQWRRDINDVFTAVRQLADVLKVDIDRLAQIPRQAVGSYLNAQAHTMALTPGCYTAEPTLVACQVPNPVIDEGSRDHGDCPRQGVADARAAGANLRPALVGKLLRTFPHASSG